MVYLAACLAAMLAELFAAVALSTRVGNRRSSVEIVRSILETACDSSRKLPMLKRRKRGVTATRRAPERALGE